MPAKAPASLEIEITDLGTISFNADHLKRPVMDLSDPQPVIAGASFLSEGTGLVSATRAEQRQPSLLVCVGPSCGSDYGVHKGAELARRFGVPWHAAYVETPGLQRLPSSQREHILKILKAAEDLGAVSVVLAADSVPRAIADFARSHAVSTILFGRSHRFCPWRIPLRTKIASCIRQVDVIEAGEPLGAGPEAARNDVGGVPLSTARGRSGSWRFLAAAAASLVTVLLATPLTPYLDLANIVMLFLLTVVIVAIRFGRGAAVIATVVGVAAFDFFFVRPRFSFSVGDFQYLVMFGVMLAVGLIITHFTGGLRYQAQVAAQREARSKTLYEFSHALSGTLRIDQVLEITKKFVQRTFRARATLLLPDDAGRLQPRSTRDESGAIARMSVLELGAAQWAYDNAAPAGTGTTLLPDSGYFYLPLVAPVRTRGVLVIQPESRRGLLIPELRQHLDTFATLAAIALERVHYIDVAQEALVHMESERLRNSLLSALSHDLRTPLTSLVGLSESLSLSKPMLAPAQQALALALRDEALRMNNMVSNLLDMARLQSGDVKLNLQWQSLEEVVGSSLRATQYQLQQHHIRTALPRGLPLVQFDAVLIERVLCNLLENASKYTPCGSWICIAAEQRGAVLAITVQDNGPGLPANLEEVIFEKFIRGASESSTPGIGLGLSICLAIMEAHHGTIYFEAPVGGGASFVFTIPLGDVPPMPDLQEAEIGNRLDES